MGCLYIGVLATGSLQATAGEEAVGVDVLGRLQLAGLEKSSENIA